jgi:hypothetical protein
MSKWKWFKIVVLALAASVALTGIWLGIALALLHALR